MLRRRPIHRSLGAVGWPLTIVGDLAVLGSIAVLMLATDFLLKWLVGP